MPFDGASMLKFPCSLVTVPPTNALPRAANIWMVAISIVSLVSESKIHPVIVRSLRSCAAAVRKVMQASTVSKILRNINVALVMSNWLLIRENGCFSKLNLFLKTIQPDSFSFHI